MKKLKVGFYDAGGELTGEETTFDRPSMHDGDFEGEPAYVSLDIPEDAETVVIDLVEE